MAKHDPTLDTLFTALGDPTRRAILAQLAHGPATVSALAAPHDMALPSFMAHIQKLSRAGLITSTKQARTRTCTLVPDALTPVQHWLAEQRNLWANRLDQFDTYATQLAQDRTDGT